MDVISIVDKLAEAGLIRTNKIINNYYSIYCPFHNEGKERRPSCGVLLHDEYRNGVKYSEGFVHCFTCQVAMALPEAITRILESRSISKSGYDWLAENVPGFELTSSFDYLLPQDTLYSLENQFAISYIQAKKSNVQSYVSEEELKQYRYTVPYMYERKLTDEIICKYDVGVDLHWIPPGRKKEVPCITFPVRDAEGKTLFICRRSIAGKLYNLPTGVTKPVYGLDMIPEGTTSIIIVESIINCLTLCVWGYNSVALLGTGNSYQINQLKRLGCKEFILCMDGDDAGRRATEKLKNQLKSVAIVWAISMPEGKDVNDIDKETFIELYNQRI